MTSTENGNNGNKGDVDSGCGMAGGGGGGRDNGRQAGIRQTLRPGSGKLKRKAGTLKSWKLKGEK
jgi:hypothetical protein